MLAGIHRLSQSRSTFWLRPSNLKLPRTPSASRLPPTTFTALQPTQTSVRMISGALKTKTVSPNTSKKPQKQSKLGSFGKLETSTFSTTTTAAAAVRSAVNPPYKQPLPSSPPSSYEKRQPIQKPQRNLAEIFHGEDSFQENIPPPAEMTPSPSDDVLGYSLCEDDLLNDSDLDFDDSLVSIAPPTSKLQSQLPPPVPATEPLYPKLPNNPSTVPATSAVHDIDPAQFKSDEPIPWDPSSQPVPRSSQQNPLPTPPNSKRHAPAPSPPEVKAVQEEEPAAKKQRITKRKLPSSWPVMPESTPETEAKTSRRTTKAAPVTAWSMATDQMSGGRAAVRKVAAVKQSMRDPDAEMERLMTKAKKNSTRPAQIFLSEEQKTVVSLVTERKMSVFFTGAAGTGKSVLLRELISTLKKKYKREYDSVAVTASTGLAACNIGGVTLHSFAGIGLGKEPVPDLVRKIKRNNKAKQRWLKTKVLVIDEISMVDGDLFDKLEAIARAIKNNSTPFGGIQLVITGDFFQLPPVPENNRMAKFAFDANAWETCIQHTIGLTKVFRQRDPQFASMLNELRLGHISPDTSQTFKQLSRPLTFNDGIEPTELFSTRKEVDSANSKRMFQLQGESMVFNAEDTGKEDKQTIQKLLSSCMAPPKIELKVNSQVMLIKNMDDTLVNGSLGRVVGFMNEKTWDVINEKGLDVDDDDIDAKKKIRSLSAATSSKATDTGRRWPLVQFVMPDGTSRQLLVPPETWKVELPNGEVQAQRTQVPLILAWALSIHKAQGQTLERVKVNLGRVFEKGQAYVALSRATCKEGLQVLNFDAKKVMCHEKVRNFYANLSHAEEVARKVKEEQERRKALAREHYAGDA